MADSRPDVVAGRIVASNLEGGDDNKGIVRQGRQGEGRWKDEEYMNRKSRKQRDEAEVSILIISSSTTTITIIITTMKSRLT